MQYLIWAWIIQILLDLQDSHPIYEKHQQPFSVDTKHQGHILSINGFDNHSKSAGREKSHEVNLGQFNKHGTVQQRTRQPLYRDQVDVDQISLNDLDSGKLKMADLTLHQIKSNNQLREVIHQYKQMNTAQNFPNKIFDKKVIDRSPNKMFMEEKLAYMDLPYRQHKRSGRHKRSTEGQGFLDDPNNIAMFIVFPVMVFIYGGCAVIYCCYKCKNYVNENQPFKKLKERIKNRGKPPNTVQNNVDTIENAEPASESQAVVITPKIVKKEVKVFEKQDLKPIEENRPTSAHASPDMKVTFVDVEYEEEIKSTMSTPLPMTDEVHEDVEMSPLSDSQAATDISAQSYPSLSTVSTTVISNNNQESPVHKSVSVQSEASDAGQIIYTSFPRVNMVDTSCQTDDTIPILPPMSKPVSVRSTISKMIHRKKRNVRTKSAKPGQIHYVENYVPLNPYRDDGNTLFSQIKPNKSSVQEVNQELKDRKKKRRKSSSTPIDRH